MLDDFWPVYDQTVIAGLDSLNLIKPTWELYSACDGSRDEKLVIKDLKGSVLTDLPLGVTLTDDFGVSIAPTLF